jgi:hypothetical protein
MTYTDPDRPNPPRYTAPRNENSTMYWLGGLLAIAFIVGGIFWATNSNDRMVADRPAATTTGSGSTTTRPAQPSSPATNAPTTPPATNR